MAKALPAVHAELLAELPVTLRNGLPQRFVPETQQAEQLLESRPEDIILHRLLIEGHSRHGNNGRALEVANNALTLQPDDRSLYLIKAQLLNRMGDPENVEQHLRDTISRFPDDDRSKALLIRQLSSRGKIDAAEGFLREELGKSDEPSKVHVTLIAYLRETKGDDAALAEVKNAISAYENNRLFRALQASISFDAGDRENAIAIMETVVDGSRAGDGNDNNEATVQ